MSARSSWFAPLWVRITLAALAALVATLGVVVVAVYELSIISERNDLDAVLKREGTAIVSQITSDVSDLAGPGATVDLADLETVAARALALHPGSSLHLAVIRIGDGLLTSARGPERLERLRDDGMLPPSPAGVLTSDDGIRSRTQQIVLANQTIVVEVLGDDDHIIDDSRAIAARTLSAAAAGAIVGMAGLALAARRSTRSLGSVSTTVRRTRLDDLSARVDVDTGSGQIAELGHDVNAMLDELAAARATRDELIASVSHELRTPLAAARGHTDLLREGRASDATATVARIDRELLRITRLVDDLLALSRAGDKKWLSKRLVSAPEVIDELVSRFSAMGAEHVTVGPVPDVRFEADFDRVLQALTNLVSNAVSHTPSGTDVAVSTMVVDSTVVFSIADRGPGVPPEVLERFGQAFVRGSESGTGLGLAVTRAVATAHGGSLSVDSGPVGTTVSLVLPLGD